MCIFSCMDFSSSLLSFYCNLYLTVVITNLIQNAGRQYTQQSLCVIVRFYKKSLMFYTVTPEQENKAIDALKFKEELCGPHGVLLLGKLLDPNGNELEATDSTIIKLAQEQSEASLSYQDEIPWGVCRLLQLFQGTNYQDI